MVLKKMQCVGVMVVVTLLMCGPVVQAAGKWAFVDMRKAMRTVEEGKKAFEELSNLKDAREKELKKEGDLLDEEVEALKKQQTLLSQEAFQRKRQDLAQKQMTFKKKLEIYEQELMQTQNTKAKDILDEMEKIIEGIAKEDGLEIIYEKSGGALAYADAKNDITDRVIEAYNKKVKKGKKK